MKEKLGRHDLEYVRRHTWQTADRCLARTGCTRHDKCHQGSRNTWCPLCQVLLLTCPVHQYLDTPHNTTHSRSPCFAKTKVLSVIHFKTSSWTKLKWESWTTFYMYKQGLNVVDPGSAYHYQRSTTFNQSQTPLIKSQLWLAQLHSHLPWQVVCKLLVLLCQRTGNLHTTMAM